MTNDYFNCHIDAFKSRQVRARWIAVRRNQNATARRLGFRNFAEWQGE